MEILPASRERLADLADLFESNGATRGCWCMFWLVPRTHYFSGRRGGNRLRFEESLANADPPPGLLAYEENRPVGWCAVGPRSRYPTAIGPRSIILKGRDATEDDEVWLVPCFFVRVGFRKRGVTYRLLEAAVELARQHGAKAIEGFPIADGYPGDYVGRERVFAACGFDCVARPSPRRAIMRRDLTG